MKLLVTTPSLKVPHGGTRVLNEWASRLTKWHDVTLFVQNGDTRCNWYKLPKNIRISSKISDISNQDCVIIGSPHSIHLQNEIKNSTKCFLFLQMLEHLFVPNNKTFVKQCYAMYNSPNPLISISNWNMRFLKQQVRRKSPTFYVGNGVNLEHFPIERREKENIVLVEGWESGNVTKDVNAIGPKVAKRLKKEGYRIIAYSQHPLLRFSDVPDEYYCQPNLQTLNELYARAKILIKATRYDARSTAPMEAMTKGTPTARAIIEGDDDLKDNFNAVKLPYTEQALYNGAKILLTNENLYNQLAENCISYVQTYDWDYWMEKINNILCTND